MNEQPFSLDIIEVASPCKADWEKMRGTNKVRQCELNVYHLSNMSHDEAEALVREHEGRICVRFYRRADGTVLTRNCPVGLRAIRRQMARLVAGVAAMIGFLVGGIFTRQEKPAEGLSDIRAEGFSDGGINVRFTSLMSEEAYRRGGDCPPRVQSPLEKLVEWLDPDAALRRSKRGVVMGR